jgi:hypothetical protein
VSQVGSSHGFESTLLLLLQLLANSVYPAHTTVTVSWRVHISPLLSACC